MTEHAGETQRTDAGPVPGDHAQGAGDRGLAAGLNMLWKTGGAARSMILAIVALQILVPLVALRDAPAKFGFQMYSGIGAIGINAVDDNGDAVVIDVEDVLAGELRPDVSWLERLPEAVCARSPAAARVTVWQGSERRSAPCDP